MSDAPRPIQQSSTPSSVGKPSTSAASPSTEQLPRSFFELLEVGESDNTLKEKYRILPKGLFVSEDSLEHFLGVYQAWHAKQTGASQLRSVDKIMRHLFGTESPMCQYLVEDKLCLVGYFSPFVAEMPNQSKIRKYQGSPLSAKDFLHPRDPILGGLAGISAHLDNYTGLKITVRTKHGTYAISPDFVKTFRLILEGNKRYAREFPRVVQGQRYALLVLQKLLSRARPANKRRGFPFPARFRNEHGVEILWFRRLCFVIGQGDILQLCFELRARNLSDFVRSELKLLSTDKHSKKIGPLFMFYNPGPNIFGFSVRGKRYKFSYKAFEEYIDMLLRVKFASRGLSGNYTLREAIRNLGAIIQRAQWLPKRDIPQQIFRTLAGHELLLSSGHWVFIINNDSCVKIMWDERGLKRAE